MFQPPQLFPSFKNSMVNLSNEVESDVLFSEMDPVTRGPFNERQRTAVGVERPVAECCGTESQRDEDVGNNQSSA